MVVSITGHDEPFSTPSPYCNSLSHAYRLTEEKDEITHPTTETSLTPLCKVRTDYKLMSKHYLTFADATSGSGQVTIGQRSLM